MEPSQSTQRHEGSRSFLRRQMRLTRRVGVTLVFVAGAALAVKFGADELTRRAEAAPGAEAASATPVETVPVRLETGYTVRRAFVGQIEPQRTVALSFELPGQLTAIEVDEGMEVEEGQVLAALDTSLLETERRQLLASKSATEAQLNFALQTLARNEELTDRGFATQANLDGAIARRDELTGRIAEIEAAIANVDVRLAKSEIRAPFDGRISSRFVDGRESLNSGQPVLELVEQGAPQVRVGVPLSFDEARLNAAEIEFGGEKYPARLFTLRPDIDPVTRTRTALFAIEADAAPAFGQTARLTVTEHVAKEGLWVPVTSLKEGLRGQWTILAVDADDIVRAATVEILHAETDRVFVRGAFPAGSRLIGDGPQRVTVGQRVAVLAAE